MPRKGAATAAAPKAGIEDDPWAGYVSPADDSHHTKDGTASGEPLAGDTDDEPAKPARKPRKTAEQRAAERAETNDSPGDSMDVPDSFEDWTKPSYADDPGDFTFDSMDDTDEHLSILWWGREGTGKTTDLARVAATKLGTEVKGRVLMINAEAGAKRTALEHHGVDTSRVALYPPRGTSLTFEGLERLFYKLQHDLEKDPESWAAVGWDSITAIHQKLLDDVIEADIRRQAEILQRAKKTRAGRSGNITLRSRFDTDRDDYREVSNQMRLLLRKYRTLPCHFLVTALERRDEDKSERKGTTKVQYGPAISPALQTDLLGYVDLVIRTHVLDEGTYYGRTTPTEDSRGKDRMFSLPVELVDPTFDRIFGYVRGSIKEEEDKAQRRMPNGAEGVPSRRSLADDDDGVAVASPVADEPVDEPTPPPARRSGRTRPPATAEATETPTQPAGGASSGRTRASARTSAPESEETKPTEAPRRSGRKSPADRAASQARAQVKAETEGQPDKPATRAAANRAKKAAQAGAPKSEGGFNDEPPF